MVVGFLPYLKIHYISSLVDDISTHLKGNNHYPNIIYDVFMLIFSCFLMEKILTLITTYKRSKIIASSKYNGKDLILNKCSKLPGDFFLNSENTKQLNRILTRNDKYWEKDLDIIGNITEILVEIIMIVALFSQISIYASLILITYFLLALLTANRNSKKINTGRDVISYYGSQEKYYSEILTERDFKKEYQLFNFRKKIDEYIRIKNDEITKQTILTNLDLHKQYDSSFIIINLTSFISLALISKPALAGDISVGQFSAMAIVLVGLIRGINAKTNKTIREFKLFQPFYNELKEFLLQKTQDDTNTQEAVIDYYDIKNITYKYPNSKSVVLKNINLHLEKGKKYFLVGENGAGKTTLMNIIQGLITDYNGKILINGTDTKNFAHVGTMYQDFKVFDMSIKDNICFGSEYDSTKFERVVKDAGLSNVINSLENKENTIISNFLTDSVQLSGGQLQKIVLARLLYSDKQIIILDEPVAKQDFKSEERFYKSINKISSDKTVIYTSHRLSAASIADYVYVIEKGKIIEEGSYKDLMKNRNVFYNMLQRQRKLYEY